jgi:hypothetical protein
VGFYALDFSLDVRANFPYTELQVFYMGKGLPSVSWDYSRRKILLDMMEGNQRKSAVKEIVVNR